MQSLAPGALDLRPNADIQILQLRVDLKAPLLVERDQRRVSLLLGRVIQIAETRRRARVVRVRRVGIARRARRGRRGDPPARSLRSLHRHFVTDSLAAALPSPKQLAARLALVRRFGVEVLEVRELDGLEAVVDRERVVFGRLALGRGRSLGAAGFLRALGFRLAALLPIGARVLSLDANDEPSLGRGALDELGHLIHAGDFFAVHRDDYVALLHLGYGGRTVADDRLDEHGVRADLGEVFLLEDDAELLGADFADYEVEDDVGHAGVLGQADPGCRVDAEGAVDIDLGEVLGADGQLVDVEAADFEEGDVQDAGGQLGRCDL